MTYSRGEVWWGPALQKSDAAYRPWLVISDPSHPFASVECIVVALTTKHHDDGMPIPDEAWVRGGSETDAYVSPWYVTTIKQRDLDNQQGELNRSFVTRVVDALQTYIVADGN